MKPKGTTFKLTDELLRRHPEIAEQLARPSPAPSVTATGGLGPSEGSDSQKAPQGREKTRAERLVEAHLMARMAAGEFASVEYEAITIKVGEPCCRYTADFACFRPDKSLMLVEAKGKKTWEDSLIKFKAARRQYPMIDFEWWKVEGGSLTKIL